MSPFRGARRDAAALFHARFRRLFGFTAASAATRPFQSHPSETFERSFGGDRGWLIEGNPLAAEQSRNRRAFDTSQNRRNRRKRAMFTSDTRDEAT